MQLHTQLNNMELLDRQ